MSEMISFFFFLLAIAQKGLTSRVSKAISYGKTESRGLSVPSSIPSLPRLVSQAGVIGFVTCILSCSQPNRMQDSSSRTSKNTVEEPGQEGKFKSVGRDHYGIALKLSSPAKLLNPDGSEIGSTGTKEVTGIMMKQLAARLDEATPSSTDLRVAGKDLSTRLYFAAGKEEDLRQLTYENTEDMGQLYRIVATFANAEIGDKYDAMVVVSKAVIAEFARPMVQEQRLEDSLKAFANSLREVRASREAYFSALLTLREVKQFRAFPFEVDFDETVVDLHDSLRLTARRSLNEALVIVTLIGSEESVENFHFFPTIPNGASVVADYPVEAAFVRSTYNIRALDLEVVSGEGSSRLRYEYAGKEKDRDLARYEVEIPRTPIQVSYRPALLDRSLVLAFKPLMDEELQNVRVLVPARGKSWELGDLKSAGSGELGWQEGLLVYPGDEIQISARGYMPKSVRLETRY